MEEINLKSIKEMIKNALDELYEKDIYLIENNADDLNEKHNAERAIVFRFGIYLEALLKKSNLLKEYNLDCEYNRNIYDIKKLIIKTEKNVIPDLIVHKRGNNENNLLVIEVKPWWNKDNEYDMKKIKGFTDPNGEYKYKLGMCIELGKDKGEISYCSDKGNENYLKKQ